MRRGRASPAAAGRSGTFIPGKAGNVNESPAGHPGFAGNANLLLGYPGGRLAVGAAALPTDPCHSLRQSTRYNVTFSASRKFLLYLGFSSPHKGSLPLWRPRLFCHRQRSDRSLQRVTFIYETTKRRIPNQGIRFLLEIISSTRQSVVRFPEQFADVRFAEHGCRSDKPELPKSYRQCR